MQRRQFGRVERRHAARNFGRSKGDRLGTQSYPLLPPITLLVVYSRVDRCFIAAGLVAPMIVTCLGRFVIRLFAFYVTI